MLNEKWVIVGAVIGIIGTISYLKDTLTGKVQPNKVSWFLWAIAPLVAFGAEITQGVGLQSLMTFMVGFGPLLIFIASFINKKSYWKIEKLDLLCGSLSIVGLILWGITKIGNLAILFSVLADGLASVPTVEKSWKAPETESSRVFLYASINAFIVMLTIKNWNFQHYAFPIYIPN